jgi:hypothetical protein
MVSPRFGSHGLPFALLAAATSQCGNEDTKGAEKEKRSFWATTFPLSGKISI